VDWPQFAMLALLTFFTGSVIGLEQPVLPLLGHSRFHLSSKLALLSFLVSFGAAKAVANLFAGRLCDRFGRRRVLLTGWLIGLGEPILIITAPSWAWVVVANLLLGIQQGLCWTTAITMMIDRTRPDSRGFATGINEFAGYGGLALAILCAGYLAARYGLRPAPFLPSFALIAVGLILTLRSVSDTLRPRVVGTHSLPVEVLSQAFRVAGNRELLLCAMSGLIINLFQALVVGLLPLHLKDEGLGVAGIGVVLFAYTFTWGITQGLAGSLSDVVGRAVPIAIGMAGQGAALGGILMVHGMPAWVGVAVAMGAARALAYPTLLAAAADSATDGRFATALGVYRFYRDSGIWVGALMGGALADTIGISGALAATAGLAAFSGAVALGKRRVVRVVGGEAPVLEAAEA